MKFGIRKPSLKRSFKARTTGKLKRKIKRSINPTYGRKGVGWIKNPKKAAYNKVYNKTSFSVSPSKSKRSGKKNASSRSNSSVKAVRNKQKKVQSRTTRSLENFYSIRKEKIIRKKWSYWWILGALLFASVGLVCMLFVAVISVIFIYNHNQKPEEEIREVRDYLSDSKRKEIVSKVESLSTAMNRLLKNINNTLNIELYFSSFSEFENVVSELQYLIHEYHLPVNLELGANSNGKSESGEDMHIDDIFDKSIIAFIQRYYEDTESKASKLKTEKGYLNKMSRNKEELLQYSELLSVEHIRLIDELWKSYSLTTTI
ncbi:MULTISPECIES: hypothetical protein [unclassified Facklamia]|uniref:hypothetical protein n=1 Tax=Facklamia sp. 252 TaxID=2678501 RepID=UPI0013BE5074|nr:MULTISPECIES: hypothetical protein [unclassified Facklamia]NEW65236.1 hypothetical protein [Facklamia sp. 252]NEW65343.1 hypothetical protein [Facklamia sp. 252]NEW68363.1 hypothetical protein [Facklamia sp. 253]